MRVSLEVARMTEPSCLVWRYALAHVWYSTGKPRMTLREEQS
jgi:hypothetical protein